jgi:hypothetical protein
MDSPRERSTGGVEMRHKLTVLIVLVGSALTISGCGGSDAKSGGAATSKALTVTGSVKADGLTWRDGARQGESCTPTDGYADLPGAQIVVADDSGKTLATGEVSEGVFTETMEVDGVTSTKGPCSFAFKVPNVPAGLAFYTVTVGRRGSQKVSGSEIAQPLALTLR